MTTIKDVAKVFQKVLELVRDLSPSTKTTAVHDKTGSSLTQLCPNRKDGR